MRRRSLSRPAPRLWRTAALLALAGAGLSCNPVAQNIETKQALVDLGDAVSDLRRELSAIQVQVDSLQGVIAKQDTLLKQLANK